MSHTNSTANLSLPQFIGSDKPTWLGDVNGAFSAIDSYAGTNDAAVAAAASDATSAISQASAAVSTANNANTTAGNASTVANNAIGVANNAVTIAGVVDTKVGLLADLTTTDRTSIVNAINEVNAAVGTVPTAAQVSYDNTGSGLTATNVQDAIDEVAQGGGGGSLSVIATAAANQTYAAQLTELETAFNGLTTGQKYHAVIKLGNDLFAVQNLKGYFSRSRASASNAAVITFDIENHEAYAVTMATGSTTVTDNTNNTNTSDMVLMA